MFMHILIGDLILLSPSGILRANLISGRFLDVLPIAGLNDSDIFREPRDLSQSAITIDKTNTLLDASWLQQFSGVQHVLRSYLHSSSWVEIDCWKLIHQFALLLIILAAVFGKLNVNYAHKHCRLILQSCASISVLLSTTSGLLVGFVHVVLLSATCRLIQRSRSNLKCAASESSCFFDVTCFVQFTVRTLYAGTLVGYQTTAPRQQPSCRNYFHRQSHRAILLAALFLVLATVTIAARCHVSTSTADSIVQLSPNSLSYIASDVRSTTTYNSPIYPRTHRQHYSTSQLQTSSIVLSSLFTKPRANNLPSDISIIDKSYSKLYSTNQNNRIQESDYSTHKRPPPRASKRRIARSTRRLEDSKIKDKYGGDVDANQISTFRLINWGNHTKPNKHLVYPTRRHPVNIDRDNVYSTPPSTAIANKQVTIPRLRGITNKTTVPPVVFSFASLQNNSAINNRSYVPVYESTFIVGQQHASSDTLEGASTAINTDYNQHRHSLTPPDKRPMPPEDVYTKDLLKESGGLLVLVAACLLLTLALGLVTCVLSHYRGGILADSPNVAQTPATAPMLSVVSAGATAGVGGMDRLRGRGAARDLTASSRDHQVRLHTVHTDIAINLPPSISLPDGEEHPFSSRLHLRDTEQESEIYQKCIRPPPNRTALESESPPPYRSSSAGLLGSIGGSSFGSSTDWSGGSAPLVVRCHSMSASSASSMKRPDAAGSSSPKTDFIQKTVKILTGKKSQPSPAPTLPPVIVPTRTRRTPDQHPHLNHNHCQQLNSCPNAHQPEQQQQNNATLGCCPNSNV